MAVVNDDGVHDDHFEAEVQKLPSELTRVYITAKQALEAPTEPADAFKPPGGSTPTSENKTSPEPSYDTPLTPTEEAVYSSRFGAQDSQDYDMRGWFKANPTVMPNDNGVHYPDTFKKPNHPTFSYQSQYHNDTNSGGTWSQENGKDVFTPSEHNLKNMSREDMQKYFDKVEPGVKLNLPDIRPEPYGLNPPERGPGFAGPPRGEPTVLFKTKNGIEITDHDIDNAMNVGLGAGPASIEEGGGKLANFLKTYEKESMKELPQGWKEVPKVDQTDRVLAQIKDVLDGHSSPKKGDPETSPSYQAMIKDKAAKQTAIPLEHELSPSQVSKEYLNLLKEGNADSANALWTEYSQQASPDQWKKFKELHNNKYKLSETPTKAVEYDYEQMGHGGYEVFNAYTAKVHGTVDTEAAAKELVKQLKKAENPDFVQVPFSDKQWGPTSEVINHDYYDNLVDSVIAKAKLSPKEKFKEAVENIHSELNTAMAQIKSQLLDKIITKAPEVLPKITPPKTAFEKGYTEPAYRGVKMEPGDVPNPVYDFSKGYGEIYSSNSPMLADMYSSFLDAHPRKGKAYEKEGSYSSGAQVMPLLIDTRDYHYVDAKGKGWQQVNSDAMNEARKAGKKGVIVDNVHDEPGSTRDLTPKKVFITFPSGKGTVKSRFAKDFDPSSPNMLHMIPIIGIGGAGGYVSMQDSGE